MTATKPWLLGVHLTAITIAGMTEASNGTLSAASATSIAAYIQEVDPTLEVDLEDVRAVNSLLRNHVATGTGNDLRIVTLQRSDAANTITGLLTTYSVFRVAWTQGAESYVYEGRLRRWNAGVKSRGGNLCVLELAAIDNGNSSNLTIS